MAHLYTNSIFIWPLLITCFSLHLVSNLAEFPKIENFSEKNDDSIAFLVVGDWGRGGYFNQSKVANQSDFGRAPEMYTCGATCVVDTCPPCVHWNLKVTNTWCTHMGRIGEELDIDFVVSAGDNFYHNGLTGVDDPAFQKSFTNVYTAKSLQKPWYIVLGNHDYQGDALAQLSPELKKLDKRWNCKRNFIVGAGIVDIIFIDTNPFVNKYFDNPKKQKFDWRGILPREKYMSDLKKSLDLELSKSKAPWKIVVAHHTIKSIGYHGDTQEIVDQILPILEAHKVDMYINGHDHCLQHLSNEEGSMQFLTSGGGSKAWKNVIHHEFHQNITHFYYDGQGFMSVKLKKDKAKVEFYDVFGESLYYLKITS